MALTRKDIRRSIGEDLQGSPIEGGMTVRQVASYTSTTITDDSLIGALADYVGSYVALGDHIAIVADFDSDARVLTFAPEHPDLPADVGDYELWDEKYSPRQVNALINHTITDAETNGVLKAVNDDLAYLPPATRRIKAPDDWRMLRSVQLTHYRGGHWGSYQDLTGDLQRADEAEADNDFYPYQTTKITDFGEFAASVTFPLGLFDSIGWEVAGEFSGSDDLETTNLSEFRFVRQDFDPHAIDRDADGNLIIEYNAGDNPGTYVLAVYLYREAHVQWEEAEFVAWENSGEIELQQAFDMGGYINEGVRLRLHGGVSLPLLDSDDDEAPVNPSYIRTQALVRLLRSVPAVLVGTDSNVQQVRREWEIAAEREYYQLPRMQAARWIR